MTITIEKRHDLFDYSTGYDSEPTIQINHNLNKWIRDEGVKFYNLFNIPPSGLAGIVAISGMPGNGKDLLGNYISWICHQTFPQKRMIRDEKPRELYGEYDWFNPESDSPLFNEYSLKDDLERMKLLINGRMTLTERAQILSQAADDWMTEKGQVMLKNCILYLTEFHKYCSKREPHKPMNKTMGGIHKQKRHLDMLLLGSTQLMTDLDRFTCLPFVDWEIKCKHSSVNPTGFIYFVHKVEYQGERRGIIRSPLPITIIRLDGAKPITELGEPIAIIKDYNGNRYEKKVLDAIKSGIITFEDLRNEVKFRKDHLTVLKILKRLYKEKVIDYGCWFKIYNSKSAAQL